MTPVRTDILPPGQIREEELTYVVIGARQGDQWVFVRHRSRDTWEMPAGHIEEGESADQAAVRELYEETGTVRSSLKHLCDYRVTIGNKTEYGRLFGALILEREEVLEHEIAQLRFVAELPDMLTYPEVQTLLYNQAVQWFSPGDQS